MTHFETISRLLGLKGLLAACALVLVPSGLLAAEGRVRRALEPDEAYPTVELFEGIKAGALQVKVSPEDSTQMRVLVKSTLGKPVNVKLPQTIGAVPVLAQRGRRGGRRSGGQSVGGGFGGMGGGGGFGGGLYAVPPERFADFTVPTVCMEYGKDDPRPSMEYELCPLEEVTDKASAQELVRLFIEGDYPQHAVQAAAWHLASDKSWEELAALMDQRVGGLEDPHFTLEELQLAHQLAGVAEHLAAEREKKEADKEKEESEPDYSRE